MKFPCRRPVGSLEECDREYVEDVMACGTVGKLTRVLEDWKWVAPDALARAKVTTQAEWDYIRKHRRGDPYSSEVAALLGGQILMPRVIFAVSMVSHHFYVPWGAAFNRLWDLKRLGEVDGVVVLLDTDGTVVEEEKN